MDVPTSPSPLRILQISDPHLFAQRDQRLLNVDTDESLTGVLRHIIRHEENIDAVLATGDIAQDGSAKAYQRFLELVQPLAPVLRGLPGNHDSNDAFYDVWKDHAQAVTDLGHWRLVLLDSSIPKSSAGHIKPDQLDLLRQAADTSGDKHILVAVHHNPIPSGSIWLDSMMIDNGHELLGIIQGYPNIRGLIWGHVHQEFDSVYSYGLQGAGSAPRRKPLRLMSAPATCIQFTPRSQTFSLDDADPGYRWIELHEDGRIDTDIVRVKGLGIKPDSSSTGY